MSTTFPVTPQTLVTKPMLERIIIATCRYFGCTEEDIRQNNRGNSVLAYRKNLCWYLIMENVVVSAQSVANRFGISHGSTVSRGVDNIRVQRNIYAQTMHDCRKILEIANTLA